MFKIGTISYNIYGNFTNYGSALQTWALHQAINTLGLTENKTKKWEAVLVDYCPDCLADKNPLDPMRNMWDADEEARRLCEKSLPAITINAKKFDHFYTDSMHRSVGSYTSENFNQIIETDSINSFVCGSDTIFCPDEFDGFDDGYYANFDCMRQRSIAYAASFGDPHFTEKDYPVLNKRLANFLTIGLRENLMVPYAKKNTNACVERVLDPTLLLREEEYDPIVAGLQEEGNYLLYYSRRHNAEMEQYAESLAMRMGWKIVEISLRAENASKHRMFYDAGVEEFLSLVKHAQFVVTNSFHGMIFAYHFKTPFYVFSREQCETKISELLDLMGLSERLLSSKPESDERLLSLNWADAYSRVAKERATSLAFLYQSLSLLEKAQVD